MRSNTLIGIGIGIIAIFGAFLIEGGSIDTLFMLPAMMIVFGGTLAAGLAGSSWKQFSKLPKLFYTAFNPKKYDIVELIGQIVDFAYIVRRKGMLAVDKQLVNVRHPFLKKLFQICIDGADPATLERIVEMEIYHVSERHDANINLFVKMGGYSPTMGIIGTVMGLISTLASAGSDPNILIHHIATAFIATMWGIVMANVVWLPIGDKLRAMHDNEIRMMRIMAEGVFSVQTGEMPLVIKSKLSSALPLSEQFKITGAEIPVQQSEPNPQQII
jgi:chemotaxis protein MotA